MTPLSALHRTVSTPALAAGTAAPGAAPFVDLFAALDEGSGGETPTGRQTLAGGGKGLPGGAGVAQPFVAGALPPVGTQAAALVPSTLPDSSAVRGDSMATGVPETVGTSLVVVGGGGIRESVALTPPHTPATEIGAGIIKACIRPADPALFLPTARPLQDVRAKAVPRVDAEAPAAGSAGVDDAIATSETLSPHHAEAPAVDDGRDESAASTASVVEDFPASPSLIVAPAPSVVEVPLPPADVRVAPSSTEATLAFAGTAEAAMRGAGAVPSASGAGGERTAALETTRADRRPTTPTTPGTGGAAAVSLDAHAAPPKADVQAGAGTPPAATGYEVGAGGTDRRILQPAAPMEADANPLAHSGVETPPPATGQDARGNIAGRRTRQPVVPPMQTAPDTSGSRAAAIRYTAGVAPAPSVRDTRTGRERVPDTAAPPGMTGKAPSPIVRTDRIDPAVAATVAAPNDIPDSAATAPVAAHPALRHVIASQDGSPATSSPPQSDSAITASVPVNRSAIPAQVGGDGTDLLSDNRFDPAVPDAAAPSIGGRGSGDASRTPIAPASPAPAMPIVGQPLPAAQAFAAMFAAARPIDEDGDAVHREGDAAILALGGAGFAAGAPVATAAAAPVSAGQPVDMRDDQWMQSMIEQVEMLRDAGGVRETRIRLSPDALGAIEVRVTDGRDGVQVRFHSDVPATRAMLAEAAPRLAELAESRGLKLGQGSVDGGQAGQPGHDRRPAPEHRPAAANRAATISGQRETDDSADARIA